VVATTAKGEARRTALQDAVIRVLEHGGPGTITHRAVTAEAGVPLAAATYYFANIDDLVVSALLRVTAQQVAMFAPLTRGRGSRQPRGGSAPLGLWLSGIRNRTPRTAPPRDAPRQPAGSGRALVPRWRM